MARAAGCPASAVSALVNPLGAVEVEASRPLRRDGFMSRDAAENEEASGRREKGGAKVETSVARNREEARG